MVVLTVIVVVVVVKVTKISSYLLLFLSFCLLLPSVCFFYICICFIPNVSGNVSVNFCLNCFFSIRLRSMKLGISDMRAKGYKVKEQILNICINYANSVKGAHRTQPRGSGLSR